MPQRGHSPWFGDAEPFCKSVKLARETLITIMLGFTPELNESSDQHAAVGTNQINKGFSL
jgi:hypothetical protein